MPILIPGRHHLMTDFQAKYLFRLMNGCGDKTIRNTRNHKVPSSHLGGIVFAVTSANHHGTKRNPIPFHLRAMAIQDFSRELQVPVHIFGIDDVGVLDDFASYTLKNILHQGSMELTPENTTVLCATEVQKMYQKLGFDIITAEWNHDTKNWDAELPWDVLERIAASTSEDWTQDSNIVDDMHTSSFRIWKNYQLGDTVRRILNDPIVGADGDLTETRDYNSYVRQMDEIAVLKYKETEPHIRAGVLGDIGCAVGSWIKQACAVHTESDFYGIELSRHLLDICVQRKHNGEFANPNVFFSMKNAVRDLVFQPSSMTTIHTSSLTHEIESYGSRDDLLAFIANRFAELQPGGVWINRDVVGPENGDEVVRMHLNTTDGINAPATVLEDREDEASFCADELNNYSTYCIFLRFERDFQFDIPFKHIETREDEVVVELTKRDAAEFLLTKDYTDNWESEMHERFCFWSFSDWEKVLLENGFRVQGQSYQNPWIAENRWRGKAKVLSLDGEEIKAIPTNVLLISERII